MTTCLFPVYIYTNSDATVSLFYMRTSSFYLSHVFEIFPQVCSFICFCLFRLPLPPECRDQRCAPPTPSCSLIFLTFIFQFPAWEFESVPGVAPLAFPALSLSPHPFCPRMRTPGAIYGLACPSRSSLPPLPGELGTPCLCSPALVFLTASRCRHPA